MNPRVKSVQALTGHQLELTFTNDERRLFDLTPYLQDGVFKPLQNMGLFQRARIVAGSVEWPGEVDLSYDTLYLESVPLDEVAYSDTVA